MNGSEKTAVAEEGGRETPFVQGQVCYAGAGGLSLLSFVGVTQRMCMMLSTPGSGGCSRGARLAPSHTDLLQPGFLCHRNKEAQRPRWLLRQQGGSCCRAGFTLHPVRRRLGPVVALQPGVMGHPTVSR